MKVKDVVKKTHEDRATEAKKLYISRALTLGELAEELKVTEAVAQRVTQQLQKTGLNFIRAGDRLTLHAITEPGGHLVLRPKDRGDGWIVFGFVTDKHLCNKQCRLDVLKEAYDFFAAEGVTEVFDAGNWIDGEFKFNKQELLVFGMDDQLEYFIENHPQKKGITTYFISGDDHEGWYAQRERINIGQHLHDMARRPNFNRTDLSYIGHVEADVELKARGGSEVMRVMHPGGGSAYAFSYAPQKLVESFQGGEKPAILLIGHYHKYDVCYPREVFVISGGCCCDQTIFMRKQKIAAHLGFGLIKIKQDPSRGQIVRVSHEFLARYDRGFYQQRF